MRAKRLPVIFIGDPFAAMGRSYSGGMSPLIVTMSSL